MPESILNSMCELLNQLMIIRRLRAMFRINRFANNVSNLTGEWKVNRHRKRERKGDQTDGKGIPIVIIGGPHTQNTSKQQPPEPLAGREENKTVVDPLARNGDNR
jgi:hypothetical protein